MFDQLFKCPSAIARHSKAPYAEERRRYLAAVDINTIRGLLGHVSLDTTHVYAEVDLEMKAKALAHCDVPQRSHAKQWHQDTSIIGFLRAL